MSRSLRDSIVVVTGGTAGVGRAAVDAFLGAGARVVALARDRDRVEALTRLLEPAGTARVVDVSDAGAVRRAAAQIEADLGPIDVWVNNAMTTVFGRFVDMPLEDFARVTGITYLGAVNGTWAALEHMRPRNRGVIVQVGSALAFQAIPLQSAYCGAKHALRGFTNAVREELRAEGSAVRIASVHLSAFNTPQFGWARTYLTRHPQPVPPVFDPAIAAEALVQAARRPQREVWVGWPAVKVILASRIAPALADRYAARTAIEGQMLDEAAGPRAGNLYEPVSGPPSATGRFAEKTKARSLQWAVVRHRRPLAIAGLGALAIAGALAVLIA